MIGHEPSKIDCIWMWAWISLLFLAGVSSFFFYFGHTGDFLRETFGEKADNWFLYAWLIFTAIYNIRFFFSEKKK